MTYKTHFVGGVCATAIASTVMPVENIAVVGVVSAFSALLPDIDIEGSKVNNKAGIVGKGVSSVFNHRGFIHTPILYIVLYALMSMVLPQAICLGFLIGTMSHLVLDTFNNKGIMWLYPLTKKHYHIGSIKTRTTGESVFMIVMIVISAFVFVKGQDIIASEMSTMMNFNIPEISVPTFSIPEFNLPQIEVPKMDFSFVSDYIGNKYNEFLVNLSKI